MLFTLLFLLLSQPEPLRMRTPNILIVHTINFKVKLTRLHHPFLKIEVHRKLVSMSPLMVFL